MRLKQLALNYLPQSACRTLRHLHYQRTLKNYDRRLEPDLRGCELLIRSGDTVLDIGANIGVYTRFCSDFVGPTGRVIALEPVPETFGYLTGNIRSLGLTNVRCLNIAASDHVSDHERMSIPQYESGGNNLYCAAISPHGDVPIRTATLDSLFSDLSPQFIKCDVEGHEAACIRGAQALIARCRPNFLLEITDPGVFPLFDSLGYRPFWFNGQDFIPRDPAVKKINYFFLPR